MLYVNVERIKKIDRFDILCLQEYYKYKTNTAHRPRSEITQHPVHREINNLEHGNRKHVDKVFHAITVLMRELLDAADTLIWLADTCELSAAVTTMLSDSPTHYKRDVSAHHFHRSSKLALAVDPTSSNMHHTANVVAASNPPSDNSQTSCVVTNIDRMAHDNHSNDNLEQVYELTDLDRCRILNHGKLECQYESERRCSAKDRASQRYVLHNKEDVYGKESITRKRVEADECGGSRRAANLKFKCSRDAQKWMGAIGRTMGIRVHVRAIAVVGLFLAVLATSAAAPTRSRPTRSAHEKSARSYLETFGYLKKGRPEVGNLQLMGNEQEYEDDFRIAIKTLQEFGGIPVTGEIDTATKNLMKQKRCGRPDREDGEDEHRRKKRFAVQGEKWKYTNLTWR